LGEEYTIPLSKPQQEKYKKKNGVFSKFSLRKSLGISIINFIGLKKNSEESEGFELNPFSPSKPSKNSNLIYNANSYE
jgi:hypothetical protein